MLRLGHPPGEPVPARRIALVHDPAALRTTCFAVAALKVVARLGEEPVGLGLVARPQCLPGLDRVYRAYSSILAASYLDIRGQQATRPELYDSNSYASSQPFGEVIRASGGAGIVFDSLRHAGGVNVVAYRPRNVLDVTQANHYEIKVQTATRRIEAHRIAVS